MSTTAHSLVFLLQVKVSFFFFLFSFQFIIIFLPLTPFDIWDQMNSNEPKIGLESISMQSKSRVTLVKNKQTNKQTKRRASCMLAFPHVHLLLFQRSKKETYVVQKSGIVFEKSLAVRFWNWECCTSEYSTSSSSNDYGLWPSDSASVKCQGHSDES